MTPTPSHGGVLETLHSGLQRRILEKGWRGLSDVQLCAIPVILSGTDCVVEAPTAGGKTEAVLFPALTHAARSPQHGVQVLYLAPLRALLNNIELRASEYAEACGLHAFKWHGDVTQKSKVEELSNPSQLLLTTPESLEAILLRKPNWQVFFKHLETIIIDEAHNFASGDRGGHLCSLVARLEAALGIRPQRIALSATVGNPDDMLMWLAGGSRKPGRRISVSSKHKEDKDFQIRYFPANADGEEGFLQTLHDLLPGGKSLVFCNSRRASEEKASQLMQLAKTKHNRRLKIRTHHSAVSKYYREDAEALIKVAGESGVDAILSTSTLELGIDIGELDKVIQLFGLASSSSLLQRVGRTGRRPGRPKYFRGLCSDESDLLLLVASTELALRGQSEAIHFPGCAFHLLAHQLLCLSLQHNGLDPDHGWTVLKGASCFRGVSVEQYDALVKHMLGSALLREVDGQLVVGEEGEKRFLHSNWRNLFAVFETGPFYEVFEGKNQVGTLSASFVDGNNLRGKFQFVLAGIPWTVEKVDVKGKKVHVKRSASTQAPKWECFHGQDVPFETAQEAGAILNSDQTLQYLDDAAGSALAGMQRKWKRIGWKPGEVVVLEAGNQCEVVVFGGDRINRTLAHLVRAEGFAEKCTASYGSVWVEAKRGESCETIKRRILDLLSLLASSEKRDDKSWRRALASTVRTIPGSRLEACLPGELLQIAMVDRSYDLEGVRRQIGSVRVVSNMQ